jgi:hypothetical protein
MLAVSMPNSATFSALVDTATKCRLTASAPSALTSQSRAVVALAIVSCVVKVLDETMTSVSAGSRSCVASHTSAPSTLETNRTVSERSAYARSAS